MGIEPKQFLVDLIRKFKSGDDEARLACIEFFHRESEGIWNGRARAKIARNLKPEILSQRDSLKLMETISARLLSGNFSEQFTDQLNLALRLRPKCILETAAKGLLSPKEHVRKYSRWTIDRHQRMPENNLHPNS